MIKLHVRQYGMPFDREYKSIEDAAYAGCLEVEDNTACPDRITNGDEVVWKYGTPFDGSMDKLRQLANYENDEVL